MLTYPKFLFHFDAFSQSFNDLFIEIIEAKVNRLQLIIVFQERKYLAHPINVLDCIVF